ncbi:MAG: helix-turn-helix domain-containing protein [Gammaproteobacteria bacterium]|nr:helix-turn-helix domain-containing protein [Gammaproteobacteria bacterium]
MSILIMSKVFSTNLQPSKKIVLLALADFANDEGKNIFPSVSTIAKKSSLSHRSVQTIIGRFLHIGVLRVIKNPFGGAPGTTRHLEINLAALDLLMKQPPGENSAPVSEAGADDSEKGVKNGVKTGDTAAPKPPDNRHKTTTSNTHQNSNSGGLEDSFDWPPQISPEERHAIQEVFSYSSNSDQQKQYSLDELRAALSRKEISLKASWVRALLVKGIERTTEGVAYERARMRGCELKDGQSQKLQEPLTVVEKDTGRERLRIMKEGIKKGSTHARHLKFQK